MAKRQRFTKEFKLEAVRLWKSSGRPAAAVARELELRRNHLYKWQHEVETFGDAAFPGKGGRAHTITRLSYADNLFVFNGRTVRIQERIVSTDMHFDQPYRFQDLTNLLYVASPPVLCWRPVDRFCDFEQEDFEDFRVELIKFRSFQH